MKFWKQLIFCWNKNMYYSGISAQVFLHYIFNTDEDEYSNSEYGKAGFFPFPLFMLMNDQNSTSCIFYPMFQLSKFGDYNINMSLEERV